MSNFVGFEPIFDANSRVLVLGSFPSVQSRKQQFYYGNPHNRFWRTLALCLGKPVPESVQQKRELCLQNGVALWDIVQSCSVEGSLDSNLRNTVTVDLEPLLARCHIGKILCNGATAYKLTLRSYKGDIPVIKLPSTSPANTRFDCAVWVEQFN